MEKLTVHNLFRVGIEETNMHEFNHTEIMLQVGNALVNFDKMRYVTDPATGQNFIVLSENTIASKSVGNTLLEIIQQNAKLETI